MVGDPTSTGGKVITGSPFTDIDGKSVTRVTDKATCPTHKGVFPIVDGDATIIIDGQPVALHGSKLACGCTVLSAQQISVFVDTGGTGGKAPAKNSPRSDAIVTTAAAAAMAPVASPSTTPAGKFDEHFRLRDQHGHALAGLRFYYFKDEELLGEGCLDEHGCTHAHQTETPTDLRVAIQAPAPILE